MEMEVSKYVSFINFDETRTIIYNSNNDTFIILNRTFQRNDSEILCKNPSINIGLYNTLYKHGIFISKEYNETQHLIQRIQRAQNRPVLNIHINPTLDCNFNCWYCYEKHISNSVMSNQTIKAVIHYVQLQFENFPHLTSLSLGFFGGEPLLKFREVVTPIINEIACITRRFNKKLHIHFTSNGYLITDAIIQDLSKYNCSFQITLDGDRENHNKTRFQILGQDSHGIIINNVKKLINSNIQCTLRINYTEKNIDSCPSIIHELKKIEIQKQKLLTIDLQRVWQDRRLSHDTTEDTAIQIRKELYKQRYNVASYYTHHPVEDLCYGDLEHHILFNYNGDAYGCTARDFSPNNRIGILNKDGTVTYNKRYELKKASKFSNTYCHDCRIAPICGGGCSQRSFENSNSNGCILGYSESQIDNIILNRFDNLFCFDNYQYNKD